MRYIFFGTPDFARTVLAALLDAHMAPVALVANPDRPVGRKKIITPPPTKQLITSGQRTVSSEQEGIEIIQPEKLEAIRDKLSALRPEFFVVAAYAKIIPQAVLDIPKLGAVGVHPSLLPRLRGASPIQSAILNAEPRTGVTLYRMDARTDHGPIITEEPLADYEVNAETTATLEPRLAALGGKLLVRHLHEFAAGHLAGHPQDESRATSTRKFTIQDGFVPENELTRAEAGETIAAERIDRLIRALGHEPGVWTIRGGKRIKLLEAMLREGRLVLMRIQTEGKKPHGLIPNI